MNKKTIGVLSDTHGLLRDEVIEHLKKKRVSLILHAGDIDNGEVLVELEKVAPVIAVRGNCDREGRVRSLPLTEMVDLGNDTFVYLIHDISQLDLIPQSMGLSMVIYGHSHNPSLEEKGNIYYLNPGSCGPKRFSLPISFATIQLESNEMQVEFIQL